MRKFGVRLSVSLLTFLVGVSAATVWLSYTKRSVTDPPAWKTEVLTTASDPTLFGPTGCNFTVPETPEQKAVRLAEEFVARNGYTDLSADRENLSRESVEWTDNVEEMLRQRQGSLERKAYGIVYPGKWGKSRWMVAFRHGREFGNEYDEWGRAVTMDKNFENLRVGHKMFPLGNVDKKF